MSTIHRYTPRGVTDAMVEAAETADGEAYLEQARAAGAESAPYPEDGPLWRVGIVAALATGSAGISEHAVVVDPGPEGWPGVDVRGVPGDLTATARCGSSAVTSAMAAEALALTVVERVALYLHLHPLDDDRDED